MIGSDGLFAYDYPANPACRRFLFTFCSDRLVAFEQEVARVIAIDATR